MPFFGEPVDYEIEVSRPGSGERQERRVVRIWQGLVLVLHQNCELDYANQDDSRLVVAPLATSAQWPEGPWAALRLNRIPGYFYLPPISAGQATELGLPAADVPEAVAVLANTTLSSRGLIKPRRQFSLSTEMLPHLQEALVRFFSVRGFATLDDLRHLIGKHVVDVRETNQSVAGPSKLVKVFLGDDGAADDDEATISYWGVRAVAPKV
jgi:hypothetical protein